MREEWRPVPGYEGRYDVSDRGRVRSHIQWNRKPTPRLLSPSSHTKLPYKKVCLTDGRGSCSTLLVHRLVMMAFIGPCPDGMEVRHLDGDPTNNNLDNLRYGTRPQNQEDAVRHGTHHNASKDRCPQGHPYDASNTRQGSRKRTSRKCRQCHRDRERRRYRQKVQS